ncbi:MAG: protein-glutamate O-methyltransferase CheR [Pseudomonadota bacterium]|nr:protein-glutamate O-methyltransferase CheR [Pseudomonadota bacterium]
MTSAAKSAFRPGADETIVPGEFTLSRDDFRRISAMIYADAGIHLSEGKAALVYARLAKRLRALHMQAFRDYCDLVASADGAAERQEMLSSLTTNVTKFFREPHHFEHLKTHVLTPLAQRGAIGRLRLWSAACSTGQEPYSIAMTLLSLWPEAVNQDVKILATDIDRSVLAVAEAGVYAESLLDGVSADQRKRFFEPAGEQGFRVNAALRRLVTFRPLNLVENWPMRGPFQAIFCRNVVIYFDEPTQQGVWEKFAPRLAPQGALYIGHSERVTGPAAALLRSDGVSTYRPMGAAKR